MIFMLIVIVVIVVIVLCSFLESDGVLSVTVAVVIVVVSVGRGAWRDVQGVITAKEE